jgi:hypothetical protein
LPLASADFATLPPHFDGASLPLNTSDWEIMVPGYSTYPETFRQCIPFFLASIVFHETFLRSKLCPRHPLFSNALFAGGYISQLRGRVLTGRFECKRSGMRACGIPAQLVLAGELAEVREELSTLRSHIDSRSDGIERLLSELPQRTFRQIADNIAINGVHPITRDEFHRLSADLVTLVTETLHRHGRIPGTESQEVELPTPQESQTGGAFPAYTWGGRLHPVPEGWKFPGCTPKATFFIWHHGSRDVPMIAPLRTLSRHDVSTTTWVQVSRVRGVFKEIERLAVCAGAVPEGISVHTLSKQDLSNVFDEGFSRLITQLYGNDSHRSGEKDLGTLYNRILKKRKLTTDE